jgi:hypothetical protein
MSYVQRDADGVIVAVSQQQQEGFEEQISPDDPQLKQFFRNFGSATSELEESDLAFVRVVEDVIELLIDKNVIRFTDLPDQAQEKMLTRQNLRSVLKPGAYQIEDDDVGLF